MSELKACPCGNPAELHVRKIQQEAYIMCSDSDCLWAMQISWGTNDNPKEYVGRLVENWNRRAQSADGGKPMPCNQHGLKVKYDVTKVSDGSTVNNCFVLRPDRDPAAVEALRAYALATPNKQLAADIYTWVGNPESCPLTIEELRILDFEKLWIIPFGEKADKAYCYLYEPQYAIFCRNVGFEDDLISLRCKNGNGVTWRLSEYGKAWLAYRARPETIHTH